MSVMGEGLLRQIANKEQEITVCKNELAKITDEGKQMVTRNRLAAMEKQLSQLLHPPQWQSTKKMQISYVCIILYNLY